MRTTTLHVKIPREDARYSISIGSGNLHAFDWRKLQASSLIIITDTVVSKLYGQLLRKRLKRLGTAVETPVIPAGEKSKRIEVVEGIVREMSRRNIDRRAVVIALGGGVVGDTAGFAASIFKRGIRYVQVPTTLMAQVDSSIGGKTGVNLPEGKNLVGTVHQPSAVIIDAKLLRSLPESEIRNGFAEVVKYTVIADRSLFQYLERHILDRGPEVLLEIIKRSVRIKVGVIKKDELEMGLRAIFNYGHTIGHAIEIVSGHRVSHGEAVAYGMMYEGALAHELGIFSRASLERQNNLISKLGFRRPPRYDPRHLAAAMKRDKKVLLGKLHFVLPCRIGEAYKKYGQISVGVSKRIVLKVLSIVASER